MTGKPAPDPFPWGSFVFVLCVSALLAGLMLLLVPKPAVHLHTLPDGTRCVTYHGSVTCDWTRAPQAKPQHAPLT